MTHDNDITSSQAEVSPRTSKRRTKLLTSLITLVALFGGGEIVCRLAGYPPEPDNRVRTIGHADYHYGMAPNQDTIHEHKGNLIPVHINQYGQRSPDFPLEKEPGEFRIAGIGDSMAFGPGVKDEETFFSQLEAAYVKMREVEQRENEGRVRVFNASYNGYSTYHYTRWAETQLDKFDPDVFIFCIYTGNDMVITATFSTVIPVPWANWKRYSGLIVWFDEFYRNYVWKKITAAKQHKSFEQVQSELEQYRGVEPQFMTPEDQHTLWEHALTHVETMEKECRSREIQPVCLLVPTVGLTANLEPDPTFTWLKTEIEKRGVPVIDPLPNLRWAHDRAWLPYDHGHYDAPGHSQITRALYAGLKELGIVE